MYTWNRMHRPSANITLIGPTKYQQWDHVQRFWTKRIKWDWALLWIISDSHNENVQYNYLSINNIVFIGRRMETWRLECAIGGAHCTQLRMLNHCGMCKAKKQRKIWRMRSFGWYPNCLGSTIRDIEIQSNRTPRRLRVSRLANLHGNFATMIITQHSMLRRVIKFGRWP